MEGGGRHKGGVWYGNLMANAILSGSTRNFFNHFRASEFWLGAHLWEFGVGRGWKENWLATQCSPRAT